MLWPSSINDHLEEKFYDINSKVPYKDVCEKFTSTYRRRDPQTKLREERMDYQVSEL